jgi:hypothetical protein
MRKALHVFGSDFARKYIAIGRKGGREEGREEGRNLLRLAIRRVLDERGLGLTAVQARKLDACVDETVLQSWVARAAVAERAADVFVVPKRNGRPRRTGKRARRAA